MKIILFDGYCGLCNKSVDWIIRHDTKHVFQFTPLQGETAKKLSSQITSITNLDTVVYWNEGKTFEKSDAAFHILKELPYPWKLLTIFFIFPTRFNDLFYNIIAKSRYKWFGKLDACRLPTAQEKELFLD